MSILPQTPAWYDRLTTMQEGYYYPWESQLPLLHGEDVYEMVVRQHLHPQTDVIDITCGHGTMALSIAPYCQSVIGYDRTTDWIDLARSTASRLNLTNVAFVCHDSSAAANNGRVRLPAFDNSFDLLICSKGPFHWIEDARRVARPGATLLMLVPDATPATPWLDLLPESLRWYVAPDPNWARPAIEEKLRAVDLALHSWWSFDVREIFPDPEQLYIWRTWGQTPDEVPPFDAINPTLQELFATYAGPQGLEVRYRRYLWKAIIPDENSDYS